MRSAKEIRLQYIPNGAVNIKGNGLGDGKKQFSYECGLIDAMINTARIEAIKECAERASCDYDYIDFDDKVDQYSIRVDKQSILQLINELQ